MDSAPPPQITVAFSNHRPETLAPAAGLMGRSEAIVLEEPELPGFAAMLDGALTIDAYLAQNDFQFPEFERRSCELFRDLHRSGKALYQADPYMTTLDAIHRRFAAGGAPGDIDPQSPEGKIYAVEKRWGAALLANYEHCPVEAFDGLVVQVQHFAQADAARGRLRDRLRAKAIAALAERHARLYVEAGSLHIYLLTALRRQVHGKSVRPVYLMRPVIHRLSGRRHALGPGDLLTLLYTFRPDARGARADLLAARSLVHTLLGQGDEILPGDAPFPHTRDEVACSGLVGSLAYAETKRLYGRILGRPPSEAREIAKRYLRGR